MIFEFEFYKNGNYIPCTSHTVKNLTELLKEEPSDDQEYSVKMRINIELEDGEKVRYVGLYLTEASTLGEYDQITSDATPEESLSRLQGFDESSGLFLSPGNLHTLTDQYLDDNSLWSKFDSRNGKDRSSRIAIFNDEAEEIYENGTSIDFKLKFVKSENQSPKKIFVALEAFADRVQSI